MNKEKVLMIVAHPDDELIYGLSDILLNETFVVCVTHGDNPVRSKEFEHAKQEFKFDGIILNHRDTPLSNTFKELPPEVSLEKFGVIVSHNQYGEYGNVFHKRVHRTVIKIANKFSKPFFTFDQRYLRSSYTSERNDCICEIYKSQQIKLLLPI